jgi:hypothetical protein
LGREAPMVVITPRDLARLLPQVLASPWKKSA